MHLSHVARYLEDVANRFELLSGTHEDLYEELALVLSLITQDADGRLFRFGSGIHDCVHAWSDMDYVYAINSDSRLCAISLLEKIRDFIAAGKNPRWLNVKDEIEHKSTVSFDCLLNVRRAGLSLFSRVVDSSGGVIRVDLHVIAGNVEEFAPLVVPRGLHSIISRHDIGAYSVWLILGWAINSGCCRYNVHAPRLPIDEWYKQLKPIQWVTLAAAFLALAEQTWPQPLDLAREFWLWFMRFHWLRFAIVFDRGVGGAARPRVEERKGRRYAMVVVDEFKRNVFHNVSFKVRDALLQRVRDLFSDDELNVQFLDSVFQCYRR